MLIVLIFIIGLFIWFLLKSQYESYLENEPTVVRLKDKLAPVFPEMKKIRMMKGTASYTINKEKIYLCTEQQNGLPYDDNMLTFVILHELAHTICPDIGHGKKFQHIFKTFLDRAERHELYDSSIPRIENYCKNIERSISFVPFFSLVVIY